MDKICILTLFSRASKVITFFQSWNICSASRNEGYVVLRIITSEMNSIFYHRLNSIAKITIIINNFFKAYILVVQFQILVSNITVRLGLIFFMITMKIIKAKLNFVNVIIGSEILTHWRIYEEGTPSPGSPVTWTEKHFILRAKRSFSRS